MSNREPSASVTYTLVFIVILTTAVMARSPSLIDRSTWHDEAITLLHTSGHAAPTWPSEPRSATILKDRFLTGSATFEEITNGLRDTDVHPPGYFWTLSIWRRAFGRSIEAARGLSLFGFLGAIAVLFILLTRARYRLPEVPVAVYALTASGVHYGHEARPYALASLLVLTGALLSYLTSEERESWRVGYGSTAGIVLGLAFHVSYLTIFPSVAVLLWLTVYTRSESPTSALSACVVFGLVTLLALPTLSQQIGSRPEAFAGFVGLASELQALFVLNLLSVWAPTEPSPFPALIVYSGLFGLVIWTAAVVWRGWPHENRSLWLLLASVFLAPSLGVLALDWLMDKHLHLPRYVAFAVPAISVFMAHGVATLWFQRRWFGLLLGGILVVLLWTSSWSSGEAERVGYPGGDHETWVHRTVNSENAIVAVGAGYGRGHPAATIYEVGSVEGGNDVDVYVVVDGHSVDQTVAILSRYDHVSVVRTGVGDTQAEEEAIMERLLSSPGFIKTGEHGAAVIFEQIDLSAPDLSATRWPEAQPGSCDSRISPVIMSLTSFDRCSNLYTSAKVGRLGVH